MYRAPEQLINLNKTNLESAVRFAGIALEGAERMIEAQTKAVKSALTEGVHQAKVIINVKDFEEFTQHMHLFAQPRLGNSSNYIKNVCDVAAATQSDISELLEQQIIQFNKHHVACLDQMVKLVPASAEVTATAVKSAVSAVNSAYENLSKSAKQFSEITQANVEAATAPAVSGVKKKAA